MKAHQLIYTSCKRGITGGGSGFQVYSCDKELADSGILLTSDYNNLRVFDTPDNPGISAFGYAHDEKYGDLFNYNTRLAHDYAGEGTRSGNLLNQSVQVSESTIDFYPAELFGAKFFRDEMLPSEVNSDDQPEYLPLVEVAPMGVITIQEISEWIDDGDRLELLESLLVATFHMVEEQKTLIILDSPQNVLRWIAAIEYCLPISMAKEINFLTYSDHPAMGKAQIVGATKAGVDTTPSYARGSIIVFDIEGNDIPEYEPTGSYFDFIDMTFDLNPSLVSEFTSFAENKFELRFNLNDFNNAYDAFCLTTEEITEWKPTTVRNGLIFAASKRGVSVRQQILNDITSKFSKVSTLDPVSYFAILEFMVGCWQNLNSEQKTFVQQIVVTTLISILYNKQSESDLFDDQFNTLTSACSDVGLNIFEIIAKEPYRSQLFGSDSLSLDVSKSKLLAFALSDFVLKNNIPANEVAVNGTFGSLYVDLLRNIPPSQSSAAVALAQSVIHSYISSLIHMLNVVSTLEFGLKQELRNDPSIERNCIDLLWESTLDALAKQPVSSSRTIVGWLLMYAAQDKDKLAYLEEYFNRVLSTCVSTEERLELFETTVSELSKVDNINVDDVFSTVGSAFINYLSTIEQEELQLTATKALEIVMSTNCYAPFMNDLVEIVSQSISFKRIREEDRGFVRRLTQYYRSTGQSLFAGKAALLAAYLRMENIGRGIRNDGLEGLLGDLEGNLSLDYLDDKEIDSYYKMIASVSIAACRSYEDYVYLFDILHMGEADRVELFEVLYSSAVRAYTKKDSLDNVVDLSLFAIDQGSRRIDDICVKTLGSLKEERITEEISPQVQSEIYQVYGQDKQALNHWRLITKNAVEKSGKGILSKFRR